MPLANCVEISIIPAISGEEAFAMTVSTRRDLLRQSIAGAFGTSVAKGGLGAEQAQPGSSGAVANAADREPPIRTRVFWTWDHSTEWTLNRPGAQTMGASNLCAAARE
jgi:hypothetical protein